ncbi:hypothetical protein [uncultured Bacteroides sp.]|uniref:hypothetical protein n=1 Tax=uncultured Bacteroides sp. TaxID=162156 RepID=UPI00262A8225|nr:hypothetical protein [uncultured Bacteroides sp.]
MSIASGINIPRHGRQYPENGMPACGISGALSRRFVCKYFAIALTVGKMGVFRFVFFRRQHTRTEKADCAATGNTICHEDTGGMTKRQKTKKENEEPV